MSCYRSITPDLRAGSGCPTGDSDRPRNDGCASIAERSMSTYQRNRLAPATQEPRQGIAKLTRVAIVGSGDV